MLLRQMLNIYKKTQKYNTCTLHPLTFFSYRCGDIGDVRDRGVSLFQGGCSANEIATEDHFTHQHLVQRISVAIQRGNAAAVLGSMGAVGDG